MASPEEQMRMMAEDFNKLQVNQMFKIIPCNILEMSGGNNGGLMG